MTERHRLEARAGVPNNPAIDVRLYRAVLRDDRLAEAFEVRFAANGWPPQWRGGVYAYHHYHSTAHEALGVFSGSARLTIGGPGGVTLDVAARDALMLPAGTGHRCDGSSDDFSVVGAYPVGQDWDICTQAADDAIRARIAAVPLPARDPVTGEAFV